MNSTFCKSFYSILQKVNPIVCYIYLSDYVRHSMILSTSIPFKSAAEMRFKSYQATYSSQSWRVNLRAKALQNILFLMKSFLNNSLVLYLIDTTQIQKYSFFFCSNCSLSIAWRHFKIIYYLNIIYNTNIN